jgi:cation diffusion facilitator CzcD-associated flavoprotein CzcO
VLSTSISFQEEMQQNEAVDEQGGTGRRIAVLGAGPIGIEAALYGARLGHDVTVYEGGDVGAAVRGWGHVTMFSPWALNTSALGRARLVAQGHALPASERCPTGQELVERYLEPLTRDPLLAGRLRLRTRVVAVGRQGLRKGDLIGRPERGQHPFRLLLDCTGTYDNPNAVGTGGMLAPGERWLGERLVRHLPDVLGRERSRFAGRRVLLVGAGLSAATTAVALARLCDEAPGTQVVWAARRPDVPPYPNDPLPERSRLIEAANTVALQAVRSTSGERALRFLPATTVDALRPEGHQIRVRLAQGAPDSPVFLEELFDEVLALCGYGPDRDLYRELQVHECYASFGPMKLAAALLGASSGDCLAQPQPGPETLRSPEPGLFILGSKSYGRSSSFLIQTGLRQIRDVYSLLHDDPQLDLYREA